MQKINSHRHTLTCRIYIGVMIMTFLLGSNIITSLPINMHYWNYLTDIAFIGLVIVFLTRKSIKKDIPFRIMMAYMFLCMLLINHYLHTGIFQYTFALFGGPILAEVYYSKEEKYHYELLQARKWLIYIYIIECVLSIIERVLQHNFLQWSDEDVIFMDSYGSGFRSYGLLGHPLQNALMVSIIMSFILISKYSSKKKYILWALGYLAVLSFNTRSSIVGDALVFAAYMLHESYKVRSIGKKITIFVTLLLSAFGLFLILSFTSWGGRLMNMGLFDSGSAEVRVNTFQIFDYFSLSTFSLPGTDSQYVMNISKIWATENFWIDWLMRYGYLMLIPYLVFMVMLVKKKFKGYKPFEVILTTATFLLIASTNNSLSATFVPVFLYISCIIFFSPKLRVYAS